MKTELHGYWIDIVLYNASFSDKYRNIRSDMIGLDIKAKDIFGAETYIMEAKLYPEDLKNLLLAIPPVLKEALNFRQRFDSSKTPPEDEFTKLTINKDEGEIYSIIKDATRQEYRKKFSGDVWFVIPRDEHGVADTLGNYDIFEEFMPFLAWDSILGEATMITKDWTKGTIYHEISWGSRYTHFRGITKPS